MSEKNEVSKNTESKKVTNYNEYHLNLNFKNKLATGLK